MNTLGQTQGFGVIGEMLYSFVVVYIVYTSCYTIFVKGVNHLPLHVSSWIGGRATSFGEEEDAQSTSRAIGAVIVNHGSRGMGAAGGAGRVIPGQKDVRGFRGRGNKDQLGAPEAGGAGASANAQAAPREDVGDANASSAPVPENAGSGESKPMEKREGEDDY